MAEPNGAVTLFEAIEVQWAKLVEDKRRVEIVVIDHMEAKPNDN